MYYISHRGNIDGKNPSLENKPDYVEGALKMNYFVEVDVWYDRNQWYLGHDEPTYRVDYSWMSKELLVLHCKNIEALEKLVEISNPLDNYFWHQDDDVTLTSYGWIWAYPNVEVNSSKAIAVLPEIEGTDVSGFGGICSDFIEEYRENASNQTSFVRS